MTAQRKSEIAATLIAFTVAGAMFAVAVLAAVRVALGH